MTSHFAPTTASSLRKASIVQALHQLPVWTLQSPHSPVPSLDYPVWTVRSAVRTHPISRLSPAEDNGRSHRCSSRQTSLRMKQR